MIIIIIAGSNIQLAESQDRYKVQPGDTLSVSVWKEPDLSGDVTVHPDGTFSVPLVGEILAENRSVPEIQQDVTEALIRYIPEPIVTIGLRETVGTKIYIIGQVNTPGAYIVTQPTDVMQALSLASGMTVYAAQNKIRILRRTGEEQIAIKFRYGDVAKGESLDQNILLQNGDVVVVP
ncbi:MAG: polysaccharide biosynthesis/export family protein [bacterium]